MAKPDQPILIKKYADYRLYHGAAGRYVTFDDLAVRMADGDDFVIHDAKTGEDITRSVLKQIIIERSNHG